LEESEDHSPLPSYEFDDFTYDDDFDAWNFTEMETVENPEPGGAWGNWGGVYLVLSQLDRRYFVGFECLR
jgi:hypothetical protein